MKKIIISLFLTLSLFSFSFSYKVDLPGPTQDTIKVEQTISSEDNTYYIDLAKVVNKYLWYFLAVVSFGMLIYAGILLISSNGDQNDLKKGNKIIVWGLVGIFVSLLSYNIINLLITLF